MPRGYAAVLVTTKTYEVLRESDGHLIVVIEVFAGGYLIGVHVADPRDYEED